MSDLFIINGVKITVDVKEITESGFGTSSNTVDVTVSLSKSFAAISAITVTPKPTAPGVYNYGVIFDETQPNPAGFSVFMYDVNGSRVSIPFSWIVRGTQGA